jgi:hypothetical protein
MALVGMRVARMVAKIANPWHVIHAERAVSHQRELICYEIERAIETRDKYYNNMRLRMKQEPELWGKSSYFQP